MYILEMDQKFQKDFFVYEIIALQMVAVTSHYYKENTCHLQ